MIRFLRYPIRSVRQFLHNRRLRRVARDFELILHLLEKHPKFRKHVRQTLRAKGYES